MSCEYLNMRKSEHGDGKNNMHPFFISTCAHIAHRSQSLNHTSCFISTLFLELQHSKLKVIFNYFLNK